MKNIYRIPALFLLIFTSLPFLHSFEISQGQVEYNIRFYDRHIYYIESNPIFVQITITNNSPYPYRFKLADDRVFSIDFDIRTMTNRQLPQSDLIIRKRTQTNHIFFREIVIESGESFSFTEDLRDYVNFTQAGSFRVRAVIYPELLRSTIAYPFSSAIETNYLNFTLRPALIQGPDGIPLEMDIATGAVLVRQQLSPDQVIDYMLSARQQSQWERFFLYLDLEKMLQRDAVQKRRYLAENEEGRRRMLAEYRINMQNSVIDGNIVTIPTTYEILRTVYNNNEGTVAVLQRYRMPSFTELRQYTYYLEKNDGFWTIVDYTVQGLGTAGND